MLRFLDFITGLLISTFFCSMFILLISIGTKGYGYETDSFCNGSDFTLAGFESVEKIRSNGDCISFFQQLKSLGDDKEFENKVFEFNETNKQIGVVKDTVAPFAKE